MLLPPEQERAKHYAKLSGITLDFTSPLGAGTDGKVWRSDQCTAVKVLERTRNYLVEKECYQRLAEAKINRLDGFAVPQLIGYHDEWLVIEMEVVSPPYILDFGKVSLDGPPDYSPEVMADEDERIQDLFEELAPQVHALLAALRRFGIYYLDPKPGNIMFKDWSRY